MYISELRLKNFKRFTDLTINLGEEQSPKLVLLIGANGSGKSAVFDAFELISETRNTPRASIVDRLDYYRKQQNAAIICDFKSGSNFYNCKFPENQKQARKFVKSSFDLTQTSFYGRSAIRYLPRITRTSIGKTVDIVSNKDKPQYYIDTDNRFENDIDTLIVDIIDRVFKGINQSSTEQFDEIKRFFNRLNVALPRVFGDDEAVSLRFLRLLPPAEGQPSRMIFKKGQSEINYDFLSSGEKEVINILFNLFVRIPFYQDTIYFFDEMDTHLHTTLQYNLLKEIVENWIPDNCQLWTASHSLGFIEYAQKANHAVILDFDNYDFDEPIVLEPQKTQEVFDIAVPKESLSLLFKDKTIVFCEGKDAFLLNSIGLEDVVFLSDVDKNTICLRMEMEKQNNAKYVGLIDRDYLSEQERTQLIKHLPNLKVLKYYCFENYLWHPENVAELASNLNVDAYKKAITEAKNKKKLSLVYRLRDSRLSYVFFKAEKKWNIQDKEPTDIIALLSSDDFETFYQVFKMKDNGDICPIKNLTRDSLVKTAWFKTKIKEILE
jgi:energy-coupling factor transporter ATP-binding protein EcfA2